MRAKNRILPIVITLLILVVIVYLFVNIKQPLVECEKTTTTASAISISEKLNTTFSRNKITRMELTKTITLPSTYRNDYYMSYIKNSLEKAYEYLEDKKEVLITDDSIIVKVDISDDETIILNNIEIIENPKFEIKINSNTKSSEVVTLKIKDKYTEGEFMTRLKNDGYVCK